MKPASLVLTVVGVLTLYSFASASADDEALWLVALEKYNKGDYSSAITDLKGLIGLYYSNYECAARYLLGRCYLQKRQFNKAENEARSLINKFPHSRYVAHAHYLISEVAFLEKNYFDAAWHLLITVQTTTEEDLRHEAMDKLSGIFESHLKAGERESLLRWIESADILEELKNITNGYATALKVGIILELSGQNSSSGEALLTGIQAAYQSKIQDLPHGVTLITRDSRGNVLEAIQAAQALIEEERVCAIIGDLTGACSAAIGAVAAANHVPLIIPAARDHNLTQIGEGVFQLMGDYYLEGKIAADYTYNTLEAERATILAPATEAGVQSTDGFTSQFESMGGIVDVNQWYYSGATNYKRQLENLIKIGADSLGARFELTEEEIEQFLMWDEEKEEEEELDLFGIEMQDTTIVDSLLEVYVSPVNFFEVLYVPFEGEEILSLAPQIAATGFDGYLLGSSNCLEYVNQESNMRYVNGIIFPAHFQSYPDVSATPQFTDTFQSLTGEFPNVWHLLGWDAFSFLAVALRVEGRISSRRITGELQKLTEFEGARISYRFPEDRRVNSSIYVLGFENGRYHLLNDPSASANNLEQ